MLDKNVKKINLTKLKSTNVEINLERLENVTINAVNMRMVVVRVNLTRENVTESIQLRLMVSELSRIELIEMIELIHDKVLGEITRESTVS